jgi:Holliday junction DNA helicase RuvA
MIVFLEGVLEEKTPAAAVLNVGGVGHEVFITLGAYERLPAAGQPCRLLIYDCVREDQHTLYGFVSEAERRMFLLLITVTGIGPRLALNALSAMPPRDLQAAVLRGDAKTLATIHGIGRRTAERLVIELKDRIAELDTGRTPEEPALNRLARDAVMALVSLGYKQAEAHDRVTRLLQDQPGLDAVEEIVRRALQIR